MRWDDIDKQVCSVARALSVIGERWTMLIIRDAFLGTRRFDQFQSNLGITRHRLSERLGKLVEAGVLVKVPYSERPLRHEYRLTRKGLGLYPVLMSLAAWGDEWMDNGEGAPMEYVHQRCGRQTHAVMTCSECGEALRPEEVMPSVGPALQVIADELGEQVNAVEEIPALLRKSM
ncbi:transcriptional regulator [Halioglobus japonicus]|uniref:Transcriptional regulator n=1 Tax=Halioglobus japonicus TaxID=930805 RepID=A0AAP8SQ16_9GAMM|nr:helix-turn-helix domain-containing protein [Halioglobus japonicus]AQA19196.1 transcriptional regulator [Halioglobus japonicus]PLW87768.1 transcriptional regulator [Halioglobus japonicus]GHD06672.1 transcriptional regulator [Halioglobus japonicus]